jgi:hypothetical protein
MDACCRLFILQNAAITADLRKVMDKTGLAHTKSDLEKATDALVVSHLGQVDYKIRNSAARMAEFYQMFYVLENDIRQLVSSVLEEAFGDTWWTKKVPPEVQKNANFSRQRESKEGLPPRSSSMIDYTTFGQLGEIIKQNWATFAGLFPNCEIERLEKVLSRLNLARGPIAHCGLLPEDEVVRLKLAMSDWFKLME